MSAVAKISGRPLDAPAQEAPALGFSLQIDLGAGRVATMQTFLPNSCDITELNAMLDKMTHAGDRQRAHYKIEELQSDLKKINSAIAQHQYDIDKTNSDHDTSMALRYDEIETLQKKADALEGAARDEHVGSGRRGVYAPRGTTKSAIDAAKSAVAKMKEEIIKAENERENIIRNHVNGRKSRMAQKAAMETEIADCELIVAQGRVG